MNIRYKCTNEICTYVCLYTQVYIYICKYHYTALESEHFNHFQGIQDLDSLLWS